MKMIFVNLAKDMGDGLICVPALRAIFNHCARNRIPLVVGGSKLSYSWAKEMSGLNLPHFIDMASPENQLDVAAQHAQMAVNLNFHADIPEAFTRAEVPVYEPLRMELVAGDRADFGDGAIVGQKHILNLIEDALRAAGIVAENAALPLPSLPAEAVSAQTVLSVQEKFGVSGDYALIVPICAANRPMKRWQEEKFTEIAQGLAARGIVPVLMGGPLDEEKALCQRIVDAAPGAITLCGQTSLNEVGALAKGARVTFSNDTGLMHIAAYAGGATVGIYGYYNDPKTWQPLVDNFHVLQGTPKIQGITVEQARAAIDTAMGVAGRGITNRFKNPRP